MSEKNSLSKNPPKIRIITHTLTTALKLWLKSQVSQVSQLDVEIKASDRQILSGCVPWVSIFATNAVYQGIHLTQIQLLAENIQVNIASILKGQALRLLKIVPVSVQLMVEEKDLNSSLSSELFSTGLNDLLLKILPEIGLRAKPISWQRIILDNNKILLRCIISYASEATHLEINFNCSLIGGHELKLDNIQVMQNEASLLKDERSYNLNLGSDVDIQEMSVIPGQMICQGMIKINP
ncbi:DUF2993 domain-containing protein [Anabaenopsis tanganyikae CS-531]|uniref:DUF2993 domain-containing protein n=2 Tax=Anabaenopsis TaxID=110103 RepID=A0ABT5ANX9_9CYAN|nr:MULTISPECIES: DUF2993 domain-containing protein [Anabaenopsis]MDB9539029.1 DUF2993 domain-containing protein [Anabaenopsis arnoldii]MDH6091318.1 DUF2993 domain-containing protein [Anabaenopsis arnoldii]MDH6105209.1 DUF2993 domain-containing protein [Anabaenopsis tanganyikae CS-531]